MAWIILTIVIAAIFGFSLVAALFFCDSTEELVIFGGVVPLIAAVFFTILTLAFSIRPVGAGHVGLEKGLGGDYVGQVGSGLHFIAPWKRLEVVSVQNQAYQDPEKCYDGRFANCVSAFTKDTQDVFVRATLNYHVDPENVQGLYRTYPEFEKRIIAARFLQIIKDETVKYTATDIAPHREDIRLAVRNRMKDELAKFSVSADDLLIDNIEFRDEFKQQVEAKVIADQKAQEQQRLVAVSEAQAKQAAASAQGEADKLRITAEGQAAANRLVAASLTPELVQFQLIQKLADKVSVIFLPSGANSLLDISKLVPQP